MRSTDATCIKHAIFIRELTEILQQNLFIKLMVSWPWPWLWWRHIGACVSQILFPAPQEACQLGTINEAWPPAVHARLATNTQRSDLVRNKNSISRFVLPSRPNRHRRLVFSVSWLVVFNSWAQCCQQFVIYCSTYTICRARESCCGLHSLSLVFPFITPVFTESAWKRGSRSGKRQYQRCVTSKPCPDALKFLGFEVYRWQHVVWSKLRKMLSYKLARIIALSCIRR